MAIELNITENTTDKDIQIFIGELDYSCYRYNHLRSPDISSERWSKIFSNIEALEKRFQQEASHD